MTYNTPNWKAAENALPGNLNATNSAGQIDQLLGTHAITQLYAGTQIVTPSGGPNFTWYTPGTAYDVDQPFVMPTGHTSIGRITIPIQPIGNGADLLVSLYPDNGSGAPNTSNPLASTLVPASWITNLSANAGLDTGGPLAAADFNTLYATGGLTTTTWAPASGGAGYLNQAAFTTSGNYGIFAGGYDGATYYGTTYTVQWNGGTALSLPIAQPSLPVGVEVPTVAATSNVVLVAGGINSATSLTANVWVASWSPNTGQIGAWSSQAPLPVALQASGSATWNNTVYIVGGINSGNTNVNTVYVATLNNGQIQNWTSAQPLPATVSDPFVAVLGNWLVVAGGKLDSTSVAGSTGVYYAPIFSDGSLGGWTTGPSLPVAVYAQQTAGWNQPLVPDAFVIVNGSNNIGSGESPQMMVLTYSPSTGTLATTWTQSQWPTASVYNKATAAFPLGNGSYATFNISPRDQYYEYSTLTPVPVTSVPLAVSALTAGATYHLVLQQTRGPSNADYLNFGFNSAALPNDGLRSPRFSNSWSAVLTGYSMPVTVYDQTPGGNPVHVWQDPDANGRAAATATFVNDYRGRLVGYCESTAQPNNPLNQNPTFTSGTSPWTATNCTIAQSSAQTHGGLPYSGLLTPNGTSATAFIQSEQDPVTPGAWYQVNGWVYSPPGYNAISLSIDWYDSAGTFISVSQNVISLAAATWTNLINTYQAPPTAAKASLVLAEGLTPAASKTLYLSNATLTAALLTALSGVSQVTYGSTPWPPTGVTQLA